MIDIMEWFEWLVLGGDSARGIKTALAEAKKATLHEEALVSVIR